MDRDLLKRYLDDGLSLTQIGTLENRDPSTVGYWVSKYGLTANGKARYAPRGGLTKEQLEPLVDAGLSLAEIAAELERSISTVRHWLAKHGLKTARIQGARRAACLEARANGQTRFRARCQKHGETDFLAMRDGRSRCAKCNAEAVAARRRKVKEILVKEAGGRCILCGYDRCLAALEFHHPDPDVKAFALSHEGMTRSLAKAREEARKCVLLCANCHAEVEAGFAEVPVELLPEVIGFPG